jgi:FtsP/CotA-like multicopper oxidase with cupredoxin domain
MTYRTIKPSFLSTACAALLMALAMSAPALAQPSNAQPAFDWPSKPIRWIVPLPPGGTMDVIARALGPKISQSCGQSVVIETKRTLARPSTWLAKCLPPSRS